MTWVIHKQSSNETIKGHHPLVGLLLQLSQFHAKKCQCSTILPELPGLLHCTGAKDGNLDTDKWHILQSDRNNKRTTQLLEAADVT